MNNLSKELEVLKLEYFHHKDVATINLIEMGKRLIAIKEKLPYGEFTEWINLHSGISIRTSQMYMKVANEFKDTQLVSCLGIKKAYKLLSIQMDHRDEFIKSQDISNMSYLELVKCIEQFNEEVELCKLKDRIDVLKEDLKKNESELSYYYELYPNDVERVFNNSFIPFEYFIKLVQEI
ncbi:MAG: DUF3102 domain-containing protein [Bacilli bacterium]